VHPHPRVTAVAKKIATAAPLALSRKRARDLQRAIKIGTADIFGRGIFRKWRLPILAAGGRGIFGELSR